jgi:uncharacterized protein YecE (DUF72 family)
VKASRFITHLKRLKDPGNARDKFLPVIEVLGPKLGPILFQLPPHLPADAKRLSAFLDVIPKTHRYAFEFRDSSWHVPEIFRLLRKHKAAFCIFDLAGFQAPCEIGADFTYVRLHGPAGPYQGSYRDSALCAWARRISDWKRTLSAIYVYFDNDSEGFAARNALELRKLLKHGVVMAGAARKA